MNSLLSATLRAKARDLLRGRKHFAFTRGDIPVCLVAHVDTVHPSPPSRVFYDADQAVAWSPDGLGADDRAGVYAILSVLARGYRPAVLLCDEEERGGIGARKVPAKLLKGVHCLIELDRRGTDDAVYYSCGSGALREWVGAHGFREAGGTFSDVSVLGPAADVAAVNLSVGYQLEHTRSEWLSLTALERTVQRVCTMLDDPPRERWRHETVEPRWSLWNDLRNDVRSPRRDSLVKAGRRWATGRFWAAHDEDPTCPRCKVGQGERGELGGTYWICGTCQFLWAGSRWP